MLMVSWKARSFNIRALGRIPAMFKVAPVYKRFLLEITFKQLGRADSECS